MIAFEEIFSIWKKKNFPMAKMKGIGGQNFEIS